MTMTDSIAGIDSQIEDLEEQARTIAPEIVAGDAKAMTKGAKIRAQIAELKDQKQLRADAETEQARRDEEEALRVDMATRDVLRKEFAVALASLVEVDREISGLMTQLEEQVSAYKALSDTLTRSAALAATPHISLRRGKLPEALKAFLVDRVKAMTTRSSASVIPLEVAHGAWLEKVEGSLKKPLAPRPLRGVPKPERQPVDALFFRAPSTNGHGAPPSVLIGHDFKVTTTPEVSTTDIKESRRSFIGGYSWQEITPADAKALVDAGYEVQKGQILPSGTYSLSLETVRKGDI